MIDIVMPTVHPKLARVTMRLAQVTAGCDTVAHIVHDDKRSGFTRTVNAGMRESTGDVMLLNDDIEWFQYGWLDILHRALYESAKTGIVGPSGKSSTKPMCYGWHGQHGLAKVDHLPFWCALIKRALIDKIGLLDPDFIHYGSDNYYSQCAAAAGYSSVWCMDVFLKHTHHGSGLVFKWKEHDDTIWTKKKRRLRRR